MIYEILTKLRPVLPNPPRRLKADSIAMNAEAEAWIVRCLSHVQPNSLGPRALSVVGTELHNVDTVAPITARQSHRPPRSDQPSSLWRTLSLLLMARLRS